MQVFFFVKSSKLFLTLFFKRLAMACLELIRENFIEIDLDLITMEEAYTIFGKYKIDIPKEDMERVESLRFNFQNMVVHVSTKFLKF